MSVDEAGDGTQVAFFSVSCTDSGDEDGAG